MAGVEGREGGNGIAGDVMQRITHIVARARPPFSDQANWTYNMLATKKIALEVIDPGLEIVNPWACDFRLGNDDQTGLCSPVLFIDPYRYPSIRSDVKDSELVRAIATAVQYPRGFDKPMRQIYTNALAVQREWLGDDRGVLLDPRKLSDRFLVGEMLGDRAFFSDFDWKAWHQALERLRVDFDASTTQFTGQKRSELIDQLQRDFPTFLRARVRMMTCNPGTGKLGDTLKASLEKKPFHELALLNARKAATEAIDHEV